ncbi:MAG: mechanosensitive ion channel [Deltaproteobacteria bacterium]|nr:mechanosensitive ion channel [Deltaproteobacteria bacterium]
MSDRAESLAAALQTMLPSEVSQEQRHAVETELDRLKGDIASRVESAASVLAVAPSVGRLKDLEQQLLGLRRQLAVPDDELELDIAELSDALAGLKTSAEIWKKTADEARGTGASEPTLRRIASMRREIDRVSEQVASRRNESLTRRDELVDPAKSLDQIIAQVREAIASRMGGLLSFDRPPVWSPSLPDAIREELGEGWTQPLAERAERLQGYVSERQRLLVFQLALFVALALGLRSLGARAKERAEENYDLREAELVFGLPNAMALVIVLGLTPQLHPLAPNLFQQLAFTSAVFPASLIVRRLSPRAMIPLVLVLPAFFLTDRLRDIIETLPTIERLVFLAELIGAMGFVLWLKRPSRFARLPAEMLRGPFFRVVGTAMRVAIGLFGLAFFAEAVGLGNFSKLVGNGSLQAAYTALFFYALLKVLQSLVAYALVLRPLRLLRLVSRNRWLVRRRLDRGIQLLTVLAWVYLALSGFEIAAPAQSVLTALLGASLSVGALSISLGDVSVFALTVWLSFALARFVNFVLHEDVFSRMQLPRGVPYAVSSLLRYVLILLGFLVALAAAGIEFSNLTIIAGGLGVGIGFGLQNVVNNFVSGLILLFERPLHVGDTVQIESQNLWGEIRRIGIRASVIRTWEGAEVIVPNGQLISDAVTNWTLSDRRRRVEVDVGVEYGTDAQRVLDLLVEVAREHSGVLADPKPMALFLGFGDSSLDFRLRAWIDEFDQGFAVRSALAVAIQRALADADISVPFPQRDLHLRTVSPDAAPESALAGEASARGPRGTEG